MRFGFRELVFLLVLLAVPVVSLIYLFQPRNEEIQQAMEEIRIKRTRLERLALVTTKIDNLGLAIEEGRESIAMIEAKLPSEQDVEGILDEIWQITASNDLTVKKVRTKASKPASLYRELPLEMVVTGRFDGFYEFLLELENLPRITRIHEIRLQRTKETSRLQTNVPVGAMRAEFTLSIYFESGEGTSD